VKRMKVLFHTRGSMILAGTLLLLGSSSQVKGISPTPFEPPVVQTPPVVVTATPPTVTITKVPTPPGGTTQSAPEPATLLSGLLGAVLLGLYGRRREHHPAVCSNAVAG
jgi:hypothetical protein